MPEPVIRVENLGKKYLLRHQQQGRTYKTLRDVLAGKAKGLIQNPKSNIQHSSTREEFWALKDVSFEIQQGEAVGIIGRNGAGKSTLLKLLSRITQPSTGRMELEGRVASLLEVGTGFHPELTGRENIYLNGAILGMGRLEIKRKFDEIVQFAEIEKFLDTPVKRYSSGMYMRLAFAVAAHLEPEILVVDEVLAVGDASFQKKCLGKMGEVSDSGRTVLFVSHQMNAVEQLCSRVIQLQGGRIKADCTDLRSVIRDYLFGGPDTDAGGQSQWIRQDAKLDNPWFTPHRFYLGDRHGSPLPMPASNQEEVWVHIEVETSNIDPALTMGYALYAESGELLYWSYQTDTHPDSWPTIPIGRYTLHGRIPARLLNEGSYRIEMVGGLHHREWLFEPGKSPVQLILTIQGGLSESPLWTIKRPGLLAPVIPWTLSI